MQLHLTRPDAVIFDMDGLLLDSERVALRLFAEAAHSLDLKWDEAVGLKMVGLNSRDSDGIVLEAFGADYPVAALRERFGELYETTIVAGDIPVKPFARDLLMHLEALRIPCAVATSTRRTRAEAKLHHAHLIQHFKALACGDEVLRGKPHPEIYELAASRLGIEPSRCLALEDSNAGVRSAVSANMQVVMVPDVLKPDAGIRMLGVPAVSSLKDVLVAIG
ncbi:HAD family phosphatase [Uliginosibacterium sp. H3]|uniref:HAD family phosphatase n=1 Tax=Uliginosibacterium silvisoli TaxID=3114758 RepID=A0ABU6K0F7_9RHOO|nr:HAD family phosphatase [Uliginosibacterium sp. H3]